MARQGAARRREGAAKEGSGEEVQCATGALRVLSNTCWARHDFTSLRLTPPPAYNAACFARFAARRACVTSEV